VPGLPAPAPVPLGSPGGSLEQSIVDLREAAAVRYRGTMTAPFGDSLTLDATVTQAGDAIGSLTVAGRPAAVLVLGGTEYVRAGEEFWAALSGIPEATAPLIADRWAKIPGSLLGVAPGELLAPASIGDALSAPTRESEASAGAVESIGGVDTFRVDTTAGTVRLAARPPHGIVRFALREAGRSDVTRVRDLTMDVTDASTALAAGYERLVDQGRQLNAAVDPFVHIEQGGYRFDSCGPASCAIVVDVGNATTAPTRVSVVARWTGDGATLGSCEAITGVLPGGGRGSATCTVDTPEWAGFYDRAHSLPGQHPYHADWFALALVAPPDLGGLEAGLAAAAATPDLAARRAAGRHHVYAIHDAAGNADRGVWKYGVAEGDGWRDAAAAQLPRCQTRTGSSCAVEAVTATDDAVSAHRFTQRLVEAYRFRNGACPPAQWVACPT